MNLNYSILFLAVLVSTYRAQGNRVPTIEELLLDPVKKGN